MRVQVLFFGVLKDLAGESRVALDLPEGATVRDVLSHYRAEHPRMQQWFESLAVAVNQQYAPFDAKLMPNDEVALLPPVSGGLPKAAIVWERIDTEAVLARIKHPEDGAVVAFEGVVRNQSQGRKTLYLEYQAYIDMALRQMESLAAQALKQFAIRDVDIVHRLGRLEIGETSVFIVVASAHRAAAFEACRWIIDTLKRTVLIWKKEHFEDGAVWADGEPFPEEISRGSSAASGSPNVNEASK